MGKSSSFPWSLRQQLFPKIQVTLARPEAPGGDSVITPMGGPAWEAYG